MPRDSDLITTSSVATVDREAYPFRSRWCELSAGRMHYVDEGAGPPIFFVHGTPTWSFEWRHLIRALSPTRRCIAPDLLGFGLSDRPVPFDYSPESHARTILEFADRMQLESLTLVVHDYGGPIALPLALRGQGRVHQLILFNTWMWSFAGDSEMERNARFASGRLGRFLYRWANFSLRVLMPYAYGDRALLTPAIHRHYLERFPDRRSRELVLWPLARAILGSSAYYDSLWSERERLRDIPSLIVWGMRDRAFRRHQLAKWRTLLPDARVVELSAAGHWPHEEAPERVIEEVRAFLSSTTPTRIRA
jgi:haloalkane dehalogenase